MYNQAKINCDDCKSKRKFNPDDHAVEKQKN